MAAVWCSDDPKNPTKLCPFCLRCFCEASEKYKQEFWRRAPRVLHDELLTLSRSKDRLGDILIRMKKLKTPDLLDALVEQHASGRRLGEILVARGLVAPGGHRRGPHHPGGEPPGRTPRGRPTPRARCGTTASRAPSSTTCWAWPRRSAPPTSSSSRAPKTSAVRYRIDGFSFRVDPIPKRFQAPLTDALLKGFGLGRGGGDPAPAGPHAARARGHRLRPGGADPAHHPRHERGHQAHQPRHLPQGLRDPRASRSRSGCGSWRSCARASAWCC